MNRLKVNQLSNWQSAWEQETRGRATFAYFPEIEQRLVANWYSPGYYTTQLISRHGNIKSKLRQFNLVDSELCHCGMEETLEHILFECPTHREQRRPLKDVVTKEGWNWPPPLKAFVLKETYLHFVKFAINTMRQKEEVDRTN